MHEQLTKTPIDETLTRHDNCKIDAFYCLSSSMLSHDILLSNDLHQSKQNFSNFNIKTPDNEGFLIINHLKLTQPPTLHSGLFASRPCFSNPTSIKHPGESGCEVADYLNISLNLEKTVHSDQINDILVKKYNTSSILFSTTSLGRKAIVSDILVFGKSEGLVLESLDVSIKPVSRLTCPPYASVDEKLHSTSMPCIDKVIITGSALPDYSPVKRYQMSFDEYWKSVSIEKSRVIVPILKKCTNYGLVRHATDNNGSASLKTKIFKFATKDIIYLYDPEKYTR